MSKMRGKIDVHAGQGTIFEIIERIERDNKLSIVPAQFDGHLGDVPEICLELLAVGIFLEYPVRNGAEVIKPWAHMGEELIGVVLIAPEVLHTGKAVKDIPDPFVEAFFNGVERLRELLNVLWVFDSHEMEVLRDVFVKPHEGLVILTLARGETVDEYEVLGIKELSEAGKDALGRPVEAYVDDVLSVPERLPDEMLYKNAGERPRFDFPDNVVADVERITEIIEVFDP